MTKTELQHQIAIRRQRDTELTNNWLKNRGITEADLYDSQTLLLQTQKVAHELLLHHTAQINQHKLEWLTDFAKRSKSSRQRQRITDKECYALLNYAKRINRALFKRYRQTAA